MVKKSENTYWKMIISAFISIGVFYFARNTFISLGIEPLDPSVVAGILSVVIFIFIPPVISNYEKKS